MSRDAIETGFEQTSFEMVRTGAQNKYELPVSEAARYRMDVRPDPARFKETLSEHEYAFIAPHSELNYLSSKLLDCETNEFLHIKINGDLLRVFPKDEEFSFETFERFVTCVREHITDIELEEQ